MFISTSTPYTTSSRIFSRQIPDSSPGGIPPSASPPLILAFLAIGLFALSMLGIFGWRRIQFVRLRGEMHRRHWTADERSSTRTGLGPRPKLYDLWTIDTKDLDKNNNQSTTDSNPRMTAGHETWDAIMPVSAVVTQSCRTKNDGTLSQRAEPAAAPFYRWTRHVEAKKGIFRKKVKINSVNDERRIQVAVAIAMPSRPIHHDVTTITKTDKGLIGEARSDDTFVYTLGVYERAWGHDNG